MWILLMEDLEQSLIDELTHMAAIYKRRGHVNKADEMMKLADDMAARRNAASLNGDSSTSPTDKKSNQA